MFKVGDLVTHINGAESQWFIVKDVIENYCICVKFQERKGAFNFASGNLSLVNSDNPVVQIYRMFEDYV